MLYAQWTLRVNPASANLQNPAHTREENCGLFASTIRAKKNIGILSNLRKNKDLETAFQRSRKLGNCRL